MPRFMIEYVRKPEFALGPHVAALGLVFTKEGHRMGDGFASGAFVARHGSWNRKPPSGYDVVLISGVVLIKSEAECRGLFDLTYGLLEPGGVVIVQDFMRIEHTAERTRLDALEHLYVLVAFDPGAGDKEGESVASWLRDAGFSDTRMIPLPTQLGLVTAQKP